MRYTLVVVKQQDRADKKIPYIILNIFDIMLIFKAIKEKDKNKKKQEIERINSICSEKLETSPKGLITMNTIKNLDCKNIMIITGTSSFKILENEENVEKS